MQPMAVFIEADGDSSAWSVSDWPSAWRAINAAYTQLGDASASVAWVVSATEGYGPITLLRVMDAAMWSAVAEDWRALREYLQVTGVTADPLLEPFA